jgi:hypothetical protein
MAGGASTYLANYQLDQTLGNASFQGTIYIALLTTLPATGGAGLVEPSTGGYARIAITNNTTNWPAAASGIKRNNIAISWPAFSADMPEFVGAAVYTASSGGNLWYWGPFSTPRTVLNGETFEIPVNGGTFRGLPA